VRSVAVGLNPERCQRSHQGFGYACTLAVGLRSYAADMVHPGKSPVRGILTSARDRDADEKVLQANDIRPLA
jgi:hypothetical protein